MYNIIICLKRLSIPLSCYHNSSNLSRPINPQPACSTISRQKPPGKECDAANDRATLRARHIVSSIVSNSVSSKIRRGHSPFELLRLRKRTGKSDETSSFEATSMTSTLSYILLGQDPCCYLAAHPWIPSVMRAVPVSHRWVILHDA
jgi:hypothetical protein